MAKVRPTCETRSTWILRRDKFLQYQIFQDMFFVEYNLPPEGCVELSIDLIPGVAPVSRTLYHMSRVEL